MSTIPLARIHAVDELQLDQVAEPHCGPADVLVKVRECGICGSDLGYLGMGGLLGPDNPMPLGHELWGEVAEVGVEVSHVQPGDRVVVNPMSGGNNIGNGGSEGGFTPYLLVRNAAADLASTLKLPAAFPDEFGPLVEPLAVAMHGVNRVATCTEDKAVIYGAGPIGLSMVEVLNYRGLSDTVVVDLSAERLAVAESMGAVTLRGDDPDIAAKLIELHGVRDFMGMPMPATSIYFEATGVRPVFESIVGMAGPGSRICLTGVHKEPVTLDLVMLLAREVSIVPAMGYANEFEDVIEMLLSGRIKPEKMITHRFPLSDILAAFELARRPDDTIKIIIDCQS